MRRMPLGIQTFRKIVEGSYVYVDKTQYVYELLYSASYYFLSRPRRFGKSLLLDTIGEAFSGDRELFKGLFLYDSGYSFEKHPVLRLDMSGIANETPEILKDSISTALRERARDEDLELLGGVPSDLFRQLIKALHRKYGKGVVVLIDEYDKPILDHLVDLETAEANRQVIKGFYGILKSMDRFLRMTFITGVSKFTKTSIFSELNNLYDITMTNEYSDICGVDTEDLDKYFGEHIEHLSTLDCFSHIRPKNANIRLANSVSPVLNPEFRVPDSDYTGEDRIRRIEGIRDGILSWYDGYSWDGRTRLINPFSLLSFFMQKRFSSFWYSSGTPTFLIKLIKEKPSTFLSLGELELSERSLDTFEISKIDIVPLLFQTGYLTVEERRFRGDSVNYLLRMPNLEVREAFYMNILAEFTERGGQLTETAYWRIKDSLEAGDLGNIVSVLKSLFASIPYQLHISREAYYHSIFIALMRVLGFEMDAEVSTSTGRIDAVLELGDKVYIMELKYIDCAPDAAPEEKRAIFDKALDEGMRQIEDRGYARRFEGSGKTVYKAALAFLGRDDIEMRVERDVLTDDALTASSP